MSQLIFDTTAALDELEQLLVEISDPDFGYWPARRRVKRGVFLANALLHGLLFHTQQWDDSLPHGAEYGVGEPPTPEQVELGRVRLLAQQLAMREQALLDAFHHEQVLYHIRAYHEHEYWRSRRRLRLASIPMRSLPAELLALHEVEDVSLASCGLDDLTGIGQLGNLRYLSVSYNRLERLPDDFAQLQQLEWFSAESNHLTWVEPLFALPRLRYLILKHNRLSLEDKGRLRAAFTDIYLEM